VVRPSPTPRALRVRDATRDLHRFSNVLVVFPHPDDETVSCGGTIRRFADAGAKITLVLLTGGERGTRSGTLDPELMAVRRREAEAAARILGIADVIQEDFPDGQLVEHTPLTMTALASVIGRVEPDLIVTYDPAGLDGHPDHMACSQIVTAVARTHVPRVTLWYAALPAWITRAFFVLGQMRHDPDVEARRCAPTHRMPVRAAVPAKIRAWNVYASQRGNIRKGFGRLVPAWLAIRAWPFEYFAEPS